MVGCGWCLLFVCSFHFVVLWSWSWSAGPPRSAIKSCSWSLLRTDSAAVSMGACPSRATRSSASHGPGPSTVPTTTSASLGPGPGPPTVTTVVRTAARRRWQRAVARVCHLLRIRQRWSHTGQLLKDPRIQSLVAGLTRVQGRLVRSAPALP